jgi:hypothetical protein
MNGTYRIQLPCKPHNVASGCACALICQRCHRCMAHCLCPDEKDRATNPEKILAALRHMASVRKVTVKR